MSVTSAPAPTPGPTFDRHQWARLAGGFVMALVIPALLCEWAEQTLSVDSSDIVRLHLMRDLVSACAVMALAVWHVNRAWQAHMSEVAEQFEALEVRAQSAESLLEAISEHSPTGVFVVDQDKQVVHANRMAMELHGAQDVIGKLCSATIGDGNASCSQCPVTDLVASGTCDSSSQCRSVTQTGESIMRDAFPVKLPGRDPVALIIENVVTEQQRLQANLVHQEKMAAFGLLAAGIAHDMGNPLSSIGMHLQLLDEEALPDDAAASLDLVRQEVDRLQRSLRELVSFARRRGSDATLVSVQGVVEDALRLLRYDHRMRGVETSVEADPDTPPVFMVEDHLMQVVLNMMLNALDAMSEGGKLRVDLRAVSDGVSLRVHDTGKGMDGSVLKRCFEPQFTTKAQGKGTGLGLSISRDIVNAADGDIELHSAPGQGTTVIVRLPAGRTEQTLHESGPRSLPVLLEAT